MNVVLIIISMATGIFVLSIVATLIYRAMYEKEISKRFSQGLPGEHIRKPLLSPFRFFWICVLILGILTLMFLSVTSISVSKNENKFNVSQCSLDGIMEMFDEQIEISGYVRHAVNDNQFQFVYYLQNNNGESAFPKILIHVESGDDEPISYRYQFRDSKKSLFSDMQQGMSGWYAVDYECFSGTFIFSCESNSGNGTVEITILP